MFDDVDNNMVRKTISKLMIEWVRGGEWHVVAESPEYDGTNDEDALEKIQISHNPLIELLEKQSSMLNLM